MQTLKSYEAILQTKFKLYDPATSEVDSVFRNGSLYKNKNTNTFIYLVPASIEDMAVVYLFNSDYKNFSQIEMDYLHFSNSFTFTDPQNFKIFMHALN